MNNLEKAKSLAKQSSDLSLVLDECLFDLAIAGDSSKFERVHRISRKAAIRHERRYMKMVKLLACYQTND